MTQLPPDWFCERLKDVARVNASSLNANTDPDYEFDYLEISNVNYYGIIDLESIKRIRFEGAPSRARRKVAVNSTAISSVRPNLQAAAFFPHLHHDLVCSTGFNVVEPDELKICPRFAYYSLISEDARQFFEATAKGVGYPAIDDKDFLAFRILLPQVAEQQRIAAYLDAGCAAIDKAVLAKQQQIQTLDKLRKTVINQAVTGAWSTQVDRRETGIPWFPILPQHWRVIRFKSLFDEIYRYPTYFNIEYVEEGIPEVRGEALSSDGSITQLPDERYISPETNNLFPRTQLLLGDLVMSVRGTMGKIGLVTERYVGANITANLLRLSPTRHLVSGKFLIWVVLGTYFNEALNSSAPQTTIKTITMPQLARLPIALPPLAEQVQILTQLESKLDEICNVTALLSRQIESLIAYRKSLIYECVTGKRRITESQLTQVQAHA